MLTETMTDMEKLERLFTEAAVAAGKAAQNPETADPTFRKGVYAEGVTRMNEENMHVSDRVYSDGEINSRTFTYNELVAKGDLMGIVIDKNQQVPLEVNGNIDKNALLAIVRNKCKSVEMKGGAITYYVNVPDIGRNVRMTSDGITHGFKAKKDNPNGMTTARATLELPEILKNSIEVNRLRPRGNIDIPFSRVLIGTVGMEDNNGKIEYYAVRSVVEERINQDPVLVKTEILGNLLGSNAKKITAAGLRGVKTNVALSPFRGYSYNIAHFLNDVKGVFKNTFSNDVYQTLGVQREQDDFANDLLYSISEENSSDKLYSIDETAEVSESKREETPFEKALRRSGLAHLIDGEAEAESGRRQPGDRGAESQAQEH